MKPIAQDVREHIMEWADANDGKVYAPVPHPEFAHLPFSHGAERIDMIIPYLTPPTGCVLDVGSHWGYVAHRLEDLGYEVTAVEHADKLFSVLKGLRDACERKFTAVHASVFDLPRTDFDIVIALNIFHQFLKTRKRFTPFVRFLRSLKCRTMIFQAHHPEEPQMRGAFLNFNADCFAGFVAAHTGLGKIENIGAYNKRQIYRLQAPTGGSRAPRR